MINFPKRILSDETSKGYRVYKAPGDFVIVEACMASEAIEKSGVEKPYKVIRSIDELGSIISPKDLVEVKEDAEENNHLTNSHNSPEENSPPQKIENQQPETDQTPETDQNNAQEKEQNKEQDSPN